MRSSKLVLVVSFCLALAGCLLPVAGPNSIDVRLENTRTVPYALVKLTSETVSVLHEFEPGGLAGLFTDHRGPQKTLVFGVGDVISVTVFEAAAGGLFIPIEAGVRPGNFVTLPDQVVDDDGNITVPYAGLVRARGRSNVQIQNDIVDRIKNRAIEPQVVVALSQQRTQLVSVVGEVNTPVRYPSPATGALDRVLDAITRAGGIKGQGYESWVILEREGKRATVPFENLIMYPQNNIFVRPGDRIYVYREQQKFIAFGAAGQQGEFNFDAWRINLAEGVAKAGGLVDVQADPGSVFLYRREPRQVVERLGADVSKFTTELIPVIFTVSFRDPGGYFLATKVLMRNQDVIFVANAQAVEITKFLNLINNIMATAGNEQTLESTVLITNQNFKACCIAP